MTAAQVLMASSFFHVFTTRLLGGGDKLDVKGLVNAAIGACDCFATVDGLIR